MYISIISHTFINFFLPSFNVHMCGKFTIYICEILFFSIGEEIVIIMIRIMNINLLKHIIKMGDRNKTK